MRLGVDFNILNQKGTPAFYSDVFANRPAAGFAGRVFISTDTGAIYEDTGSAWVLIADATGTPSVGTLQSVTANGNSTNNGITITANGISTNSITNTGNTNGSVLFAGAAGLESQSNATFFWDNINKRLGIGNASPGAPLDIHSTGTNAHFNGTGTNNAYVFFQNAGTSKWRIGNLYSAGANNFELHNAATATTALSFNGTTSNATFAAGLRTTGTADQQLWVYGTSPSLRLYDNATSPNINGFVGMSTATNNFIVGSASGDMCIGTSTGGKIYIGSGTTTVNPAMTVVSTGTVGFGTTLPNMRISTLGFGDYTTGSINVAEFVDQIGSSAKRGIILGYYANGTNAIAGSIRVPNNGNLVINPDGGNTLIGTITDLGASYKLQTLGSGGVASTCTGAGDAAFYSINTGGGYHFYGANGTPKFYVVNSGQIYSTSVTINLISSDRNLKTDIKDYDKGLAEILAMKPRYYKYKDNLEEEKCGFIAQEMDEAISGSMIDSPDSNHKTYHIEWYPLLVKAIQELNDKLVKNNIN